MEKWLLKVEETMKSSLTDICRDAVEAYSQSVRVNWVLTWPGMIVICGSCVHWTTEVSVAFEDNSLGVS